MTAPSNPFITKSYLRSVLDDEYQLYLKAGDDDAVRARLAAWARRPDHGEASAEAPFVQTFFVELWGYAFGGQDGGEDERAYTLYPQFPVVGAGAGGGTGKADLALGWFDRDGVAPTPQVLCEFKDIRSDLDAPQKGRRNDRSPVRQALDYLSAARKGLLGRELVQPLHAVVTDMNEFRLYWLDRAPEQFIRFQIEQRDLLSGGGERALLADGEEARFERFLFRTLFARDMLLTTGGRPRLTRMVSDQWVREKKIEKDFYKEYKAYRTKLYETLVQKNPDWLAREGNTRGKLVRLTQKILDRMLFVFFCEDMGRAISYPPQLLRDYLVKESRDEHYDPLDADIWNRIKKLFRAMNEGGRFGDQTVNMFNGGLFAHDPDLDALTISNALFCYRGQGENEASLASRKDTLLYLSATYNYATDGVVLDPDDPFKTDPARSLSLYTLGRIFEQSITELEMLEAEAEGRPSLNKVGKRKTDGVYYTPEWVVDRIVSETIGRRLDDMKADAGWPAEGLPNAAALQEYRRALTGLKVVDPACGSGAFLISALVFLLREWEWLQEQRKLVSGEEAGRDSDELIRHLLQNSIYGVDINPASVEIAQLALWLHTARGDKPLSTLDDTIVCGNSLVAPDFYEQGDFADADWGEERREQVNAFDWEAAFPDVFAGEGGGFDCVVGNPPYVKLQNLKKVQPEVADYLRGAYDSAETGNFDLYLPFIEKGLDVLNPSGRLGYIAPSLWPVNEYGAGLREMVMRERTLCGWVDFGAYQVFDEATIYTALQFFTKQGCDGTRLLRADDGAVEEDVWPEGGEALAYDRFGFGDRWLLLDGEARALIDKAGKAGKPLGADENTNGVFVGVQTSADYVYHLTKIAPGRYLSHPPKPKGEDRPPPYEVALEDGIMRPLISGSEARRYEDPATDTYVLFPYEAEGAHASLIPISRMQSKFKKAWDYLRTHEDALRAREAKKDKDGAIKRRADGTALDAPFDDDEWYRFGRNQNIALQDKPKIMVAQTVQSLRLSYDAEGDFCMNNVRVNGIVPSMADHYVLGVMNAPVADYVFRRIAKPKAGGFFEANKQFIEPIPIADASPNERGAVSAAAEQLQADYTRRRDLMTALAERMAQLDMRRPKPLRWLFPDLPAADAYAEDAPPTLDARAAKRWVKAEEAKDAEERYDALEVALRASDEMDARFEDGALRFEVGGSAMVGPLYLDEEEGAFALAQWKVLAATFPVTARTKGKTLADALRKVGMTDNRALREQIVKKQEALTALDAEIARTEASLNEIVYRLYGLTPEEVALVEAG